tara:strand:+ start:229 stop:555 length:327 start_codon:yes stop_codon:yes gene_type:complete
MRVRLDVGGVVFHTTQTTLQQYDSFFSGLSVANDEFYFIDRDPTHFRHVLNFLRNSPTFPMHEHELHELIQEADFYAMPTLQFQASQRLGRARKQTIEYQLGVMVAKM